MRKCRPKLDGHTYSWLSVICIIKKKEEERERESEREKESERKKKQEYIVRNI